MRKTLDEQLAAVDQKIDYYEGAASKARDKRKTIKGKIAKRDKKKHNKELYALAKAVEKELGTCDIETVMPLLNYTKEIKSLESMISAGECDYYDFQLTRKVNEPTELYKSWHNAIEKKNQWVKCKNGEIYNEGSYDDLDL